MSSAVKVPQNVFEGLEFVRESGLTNMMDFNQVQRIAHENDFCETVLWMEDNKKEYTQGFFHGFEPIEE